MGDACEAFGALLGPVESLAPPSLGTEGRAGGRGQHRCLNRPPCCWTSDLGEQEQKCGPGLSRDVRRRGLQAPRA